MKFSVYKKLIASKFAKFGETFLSRQLGADHVDIDEEEATTLYRTTKRRDRSRDMQKSLTRRDRPGITDTMIKIERTRRALRLPSSAPSTGPILSLPSRRSRSWSRGSRHDPTIAKVEVVLLRVSNEMTDITVQPSMITVRIFSRSLSALLCSKYTEIDDASTLSTTNHSFHLFEKVLVLTIWTSERLTGVLTVWKLESLRREKNLKIGTFERWNIRKLSVC